MGASLLQRHCIISSVLGASLHLRPQLQLTLGLAMSSEPQVWRRKRLRAQLVQGGSSSARVLLQYLLKKAVSTFIMRYAG